MTDDLSKLPLEFSRGEAWNYSVSTDVIGYLIGNISGTPFDQFLRERIFNPLGMNDTDFFVPRDKAHRLAACYSRRGQGGLTRHDRPPTTSFLLPPSFLAASGRCCSTAAARLTFLPAPASAARADTATPRR